jgi:hypothetical protein
MARSEHHPNGLIHHNPQLSYKGYTLFSADTDKAMLIDMQGRFVHSWQCALGITNAELLPNGNLLAYAMPSKEVEGQRGLNGQAAAIFELDWHSSIVWQYDDPWLHHDFQRLDNGNTLLVKWKPLPKSLVKRIKGGYNADEDDPTHMLGDLIVEITPAGEIVREWKSWEQLDPGTELICPLDHRLEWSHCNSLYLAPNGDWILSFRRISTIIQVNPKSGKLRWKWGDGTTSHQHDVKYSSDHTITIFDNGIHRKTMDYSRVLEVDVKTKEIVWEYADDPPFSFYTVMGGGVDRLPNGNMLICETSKGQFFEVTRDKKVVWDYINPFFVNNPRLGGRMNLVFRCHRYGPDHPALVGKDLDPLRLGNLNRLYGNL